MSLGLIDHPPTTQEFEKFRLILSTYQDGTGMLPAKSGRTLPGWRDFERSVALAFNGYAPENKAIFDVRLPDPERPGIVYGISCKMRGELDRVIKKGRVTIELSNSAKKFWVHLQSKEITQTNYKSYPIDVGCSLIELVEQWHFEVNLENGGDIDLSKSCYLVLSWNKEGFYQLHQFELKLPNCRDLDWYFPTYTRKGVEALGNHLNGDDNSGTIFEWYGESGGQLKYYPLAETATWASELFRLEPLPAGLKHGIIAKAENYFPQLWSQVSDAT